MPRDRDQIAAGRVLLALCKHALANPALETSTAAIWTTGGALVVRTEAARDAGAIRDQRFTPLADECISTAIGAAIVHLMHPGGERIAEYESGSSLGCREASADIRILNEDGAFAILETRIRGVRLAAPPTLEGTDVAAGRIPRVGLPVRAARSLRRVTSHARKPMNDVAARHDEWTTKEELAERMIPLIGALRREHDVVTSLHGHRLLGLSATGLLEVHDRVARIGHAELPLDRTLETLEGLHRLAPGASSIDVARLVEEHAASGRPLDEYLAEALAPALGAEAAEPTDVVLYGFGRIGRLLARILIAHTSGGSGLRLRAIVVRRGAENDLVKRASLLQRDSVHGRFEGSVSVDEDAEQIIANGTRIQVIYSDDPAAVDYTAYGIRDAIVVDNTGRWRDEEGLSRHLRSTGVARVLLTAPGKGALKNIVHGINHETIDDSDRILSAASCTTNAITPVLKAVDEAYGIVRGHVETVHSFTNDQNLIDNFHKGDRRGRSAVLNMVITETGAAKAVARALPELAGKLTGSAIRVPTPDVSLAVLHLTLENPADRDELNDYLRRASLHSKLRQQIDYLESPEVVSTDFVGSHRAGIVDGLATIATGHDVVLYVWYDNEYGYSCQVVRVIEVMAGSHPVVIPARREVTLRG